jgi:diguanylate cyclase (GGDEF)-like protein
MGANVADVRRLRTIDGPEAWALRDAALSEITHLLVGQGSPERVIEAVAEALREFVPYDTMTVYRADNALRVLRPVLIRDAYAPQIVALGDLPFGHGITGAVAETRMPQHVNDVMSDPRAVYIPDTPDEAEALIAVPLLVREELKGVLCLYRLGEGNVFSRDEFKLAVRFAELAALAIDNADIRERLESEVVTDHLTGLYNHRYFHERLQQEVHRASRQHSKLGLLLFDIDDFKRVNDVHGHLVGDQVLQGLAACARNVVRSEEVVCRIGGEEFAILLPGSGADETATAAERLRRTVAHATFPSEVHVTVSAGVAEAPRDASSPRELLACADLALLEAKASGKNRVVLSSAQQRQGRRRRRRRRESARSADPSPGMRSRMAALALRGEPRSLAHLRMLHSVSARLDRLNDVTSIGHAIVTELKALIDYHGARVYILQTDGETLYPIANRGELIEYQGETIDALISKVGEGITGVAVERGETIYAPNAEECEFAVQIPGTGEILESILAVPMSYGERIIGAIVLTKLGEDQFDQEDRQLVEVLAYNAGVAFENARLYEEQRESAEVSGTLLQLSKAMTRAVNAEEVLDEALRAVTSLLGCQHAVAYLLQPGGDLRIVRHRGFDPTQAERLEGQVIGAQRAARIAASPFAPFLLARDVVASLPEYPFDEPRELLVAPLRWEADGLGAIVVGAPTEEASFGSMHLRLAEGMADIVSLALANARRFAEVEQAYVSTVEALAGALEAVDAYTSNHARALAEMALAVGTRMGMDAGSLKRLELAALFHDIGKIGVPSEIIRKAGPLTPEERRVMNLHPEIGDKILEPVPFLQPIRSIVRACHERWDGQGYPEGRAGEAIPIEARIVFVCDAFHAMTTDRPYRGALPEEEAIRQLKEGKGTQFDPMVADVFIELFDDGSLPLVHHAESVLG